MSVSISDLTINIPEDSTSLILNNKITIDNMLNITGIPIRLKKVTSHLIELSKFDHKPSVENKTPSLETIIAFSSTVAILIGAIMILAVYLLQKWRR